MTTQLYPRREAARAARCLRLIALLALGLGACADAGAPALPACDGSDDVATASQSVIYGETSWVSPEAATELLSAPEAAAVAAEVAIMGRRNQTGANGAALTQSSLLCDDEPLADEVALSRCSGVLVAPDLMVTARHCTESVPCDEMVVTTDFDAPLRSDEEWGFEGRQCVRVLASNEELDTAVVELAPSTDSTVPVARLRVDELTSSTPAILVSHPLGTSTKVDMDADARPSARGPGHMWFRGDAFKGSSGAGVFDTRGRLIGLVTAGLSDFDYHRDAECMHLVRSDSEGFERLASVLSVIGEACGVTPENTLCSGIIESPATEPDVPEQRGCGQ